MSVRVAYQDSLTTPRNVLRGSPTIGRRGSVYVSESSSAHALSPRTETIYVSTPSVTTRSRAGTTSTIVSRRSVVSTVKPTETAVALGSLGRSVSYASASTLASPARGRKSQMDAATLMAGSTKTDEVDLFGNCIHAEYVWVDETGAPQSKWKTLGHIPLSVADVPEWEVNGFNARDVVLTPQALYACPFKGGDHILVVCEVNKMGTFVDTPEFCNTRASCTIALNENDDLNAQFAVTQEVGLVHVGNNAEVSLATGADVMTEVHHKCLTAGVAAGPNCTSLSNYKGKWSLEIRKCAGVEAADHLVAARHILKRVAEMKGLRVTTESGSTRVTFQPIGALAYESAIREAFIANHDEHMRAYQSVHHKLGNQFASFREEVLCADPLGYPEQLVRLVGGGVEDSRAHADADIYAIMTRMVRTAAAVVPGARTVSVTTTTVTPRPISIVQQRRSTILDGWVPPPF